MNLHLHSILRTHHHHHHLGAKVLFVTLLYSRFLGICHGWPTDAAIAASAATTWQPPIILRGGGSSSSSSARQVLKDDEEDDDEEEADQQKRRRSDQVQAPTQQLIKYYMDQQLLMQIRGTLLTEVLARRGLPLNTMETVATPEGAQKPQLVDWDCAMSTRDQPKTCLYSFDAEPMTKVVAPLGTQQWISLSALNRLRRTDPTKVEPMWHSQYTILLGWFGQNSEYSLWKDVGLTGLILSVILDQPIVLRSLLGCALLTVVLVVLPILEFLVHKVLISPAFWNQWPTWGRIAHAALPLKLLLAQMAYKGVARMCLTLERKVRDVLIDMESSFLEGALPLTVGPGSETVQVEGDFERELVEEDGEEEDDNDNDDELDPLDEEVDEDVHEEEDLDTNYFEDEEEED